MSGRNSAEVKALSDKHQWGLTAYDGQQAQRQAERLSPAQFDECARRAESPEGMSFRVLVAEMNALEAEVPYHLPSCQCGGSGLVSVRDMLQVVNRKDETAPGRTYDGVRKCEGNQGKKVTPLAYANWEATAERHARVTEERTGSKPPPATSAAWAALERTGAVIAPERRSTPPDDAA